MKKEKAILVDMDNICVDMISRWMQVYNDYSGENVDVNVTQYEVRSVVENPKLLDEILHSEHFFSTLPPIRGAVKYLNLLIAEGYDLIFLTQAPRNSQFAMNEKKEWLCERLKNFNKTNVIFAHHKELVGGAILFDDKPEHLIEWKNNFPDGKTVTIDYLYNKDVKCDLRLNKSTAWKEFYFYVREFFKK